MASLSSSPLIVSIILRFSPPESDRFCILRTHLLRLCISITDVSRPILQRMFLELETSSHLLTSLKIFVKHFYTIQKQACDKFDPSFYSRFKKSPWRETRAWRDIFR